MKVLNGTLFLVVMFIMNFYPQNHTGQSIQPKENNKSGSFSFSDLAGGVNNSVYAIEVSGSDVYVGGRFTIAGGTTVNHIARWDGTNWYPLGTGVSGTGLGISVKAISVVGDKVYVGGNFTNAGGTSVNNIAVWNGTTWEALGSGSNNGVHGGIVNSIVASDTIIYVGGLFTGEGNKSIVGIVRWDGYDWTPIGNQISQSVKVTSLYISETDLYVGGTFPEIGNTQANNIAKWDGSTWSPLGDGIPGNGPVYSITGSGGFIYAGTVIPGNTTSTHNILKWNGTSWDSVGGNIGTISGDRVNNIAVVGNYIYAGGEFHKSDGSPFYFSKFDGIVWNDINVDDRVYILKFNNNNNKILIGGDFIYAGNTNVNHIAEFTDEPVNIEESTRLPSIYRLEQNYPNPFNPSTIISWQSAVSSWQTLKVYDVLGNEIATLVDEYKSAGTYEVEFGSHSVEGRNLTSGIYFYRLKVGDTFIQTKKMLLLK